MLFRGDLLKISLQLVILIIVLLSLIDQSFALSSATGCDTSGNAVFANKQVINDHDAKPFDKQLSINKTSSINKSSAIDEDCCDIDCCADGCICIAGACSSLVYITNELGLTYITDINEVSYLHLHEQLDSIAILLRYRPPILIS